MANGEWRMANGEWRVANGEWRMASGEWRMASGEWRRGAVGDAKSAKRILGVKNFQPRKTRSTRRDQARNFLDFSCGSRLMVLRFFVLDCAARNATRERRKSKFPLDRAGLTG